jgi:hypothetical protein
MSDLSLKNESRDGQPTPRQVARAERSRVILEERRVPMYWQPLYVDDDDEARLQEPTAVAKRTLVLWAVQLRAEGVEQQEVIQILDQLDLWEAVSPAEQRFLRDPDPDPKECTALTWRLESIWILLWALGYVEELDWPAAECGVNRVVAILGPRESDADFVTSARLRPIASILDAQDLTMKIHWAIRDACLHRGGLLPENLDWRSEIDWVAATTAPAVGVVEQRHYAFNWLVNYLDPADWDHVDTPT